MLTEIEKLKYQQMEQSQLDGSLIAACTNGNIEIVKYLLTSPELTEHANIHSQHDMSLRYLCCEGHLEIIRYLLTSPELIDHANIHADNDDALRLACWNGCVDIVEYLLTSPELKIHANVHSDKDNPFANACINEQIPVIQYLIFDFQIEKTKHIEEHLIKNDREDILHLFDKREFQKKLQGNLKHQKNTNNKMKL